MPPSHYHPYRLDMGPRWRTKGIADYVPPKLGPRYVCLVPQVDEDGNEIAGIRLPEITAPTATYTGWGMRSPSYSRTLGRNMGRVRPLPITAEERKEKGDPRKSILERFPTKAEYLYEVTKSILHLKQQRLLLDEDATRLLMEAAQTTYWPIVEDIPLVEITEVLAEPAEVRAGDALLLSVGFRGLIEDILTVQLAEDAGIKPQHDHPPQLFPVTIEELGNRLFSPAAELAQFGGGFESVGHLGSRGRQQR